MANKASNGKPTKRELPKSFKANTELVKAGKKPLKNSGKVNPPKRGR